MKILPLFSFFLTCSLCLDVSAQGRGFGDLVAGPYDVQTPVNDIFSFGVEHAWGHFWVTSRGTGGPGTQQIHKYREDGTWLASYPQTVNATQLSGFGGMDMEADETANTLWIGNSLGEVVAMNYDPATGGLSYQNTFAISGYSGVVRGLCRNPNSGNFFMKSYGDDLIEFDSAGNIINSFTNIVVRSHGLAWDTLSNTIWSSDFSASAVELNPSTGMPSGRVIHTGGLGTGTIQGGCDVYSDPRNPNLHTIVLLGQGLSGGVDLIASYDLTGQPPNPWTNLPTTFLPANGFSEDFENLGGVVPPYMGVHELDDATVTPDPEAWCNVGQRAIQNSAFTGSGSLEMGLDPNSNNYHYVRNAMVLGLDGQGATNLHLEFQVSQHSEENHWWDGVFLSNNGVDWDPVYWLWDGLPDHQWQKLSDLDLTSTSVDTSGTFYLMFAQTDNYPVNVGSDDGVHIDDILIYEPYTGPWLTINNLSGGLSAQIDITNCSALGQVNLVWSVTGGGPINTPFGLGFVSQPITIIPQTADQNGEVHFTQSVPPFASGMNIWFHGVDIGSGTMLNPLALVIG